MEGSLVILFFLSRTDHHLQILLTSLIISFNFPRVWGPELDICRTVGYLQNKNNNTVIELYNMFSRYRWQTYILAEAATAIMGPGMTAMTTAAMATPTATVQAIPAPGTAHRAPAEGHAGAGDEGGDGGPRGHENRGVYGPAAGIGGYWGSRRLLGLLLGGETPPPVPPRGVSCRNPYLLKNEQYY